MNDYRHGTTFEKKRDFKSLEFCYFLFQFVIFVLNVEFKTITKAFLPDRGGGQLRRFFQGPSTTKVDESKITSFSSNSYLLPLSVLNGKK